MNIATALNRKYIPYTIVMLSSLCSHHAVHVDAFLLHSELTAKDIAFMESALGHYDISIHAVRIDRERFDARLPCSAEWTIETYYRLMLPEVIPAEVTRLLYLDADVIVNTPITELYDADFGGKEILATCDMNDHLPQEVLDEIQQRMFAPLFAEGYRYFCAGVMLMNIEAIRGKYTFDSYAKAFEAWNYRMGAPDQDILNYVHWQGVGYVDCNRYDLYARAAHKAGVTYEEVKASTSIVHFVGDKPWSASGLHFDIEKLWWDYAKRTPVYGQLLEAFVEDVMTNPKLPTYVHVIEEENAILQKSLSEIESALKVLNMV